MASEQVIFMDESAKPVSPTQPWLFDNPALLHCWSAGADSSDFVGSAWLDERVAPDDDGSRSSTVSGRRLGRSPAFPGPLSSGGQ